MAQMSSPGLGQNQGISTRELGVRVTNSMPGDGQHRHSSNSDKLLGLGKVFSEFEVSVIKVLEQCTRESWFFVCFVLCFVLF